MTDGPPVVRRGEYSVRGEYHKPPVPNREFHPACIASLNAVGWPDRLPAGTRVPGAGWGRGILVHEAAAASGSRNSMQTTLQVVSAVAC